MKLLLKQPDVSILKGRRDLALLSLLYDSAARVQEIIDLTPSAIRFDTPPVIKLTGKGNKARLVPMLEQQLLILKGYVKEFHLNEGHLNMHPLFFNSRKEKLTRQGINYIVKKYTDMARETNSVIIPSPITCHCIRHSKAMHLLQAGINLVYIRDILGHKSVQTTEIYARADSKQKRAALESSYVQLSPNEEPLWDKDMDLISWLKKF